MAYSWLTPPKTNVKPENLPRNFIFQTSISRFYVSFWGFLLFSVVFQKVLDDRNRQENLQQEESERSEDHCCSVETCVRTSTFKRSRESDSF